MERERGVGGDRERQQAEKGEAAAAWEFAGDPVGAVHDAVPKEGECLLLSGIGPVAA